MGKVIMSGIVEPLTKPIALPPIGTALEDMSWEDVRKISDAGKAANYFSVGDTKSVVVNGTVGKITFSNFAVDAFVVGIDHNQAVEGNGIHFQIGKISGKPVVFVDSGYGNAYSESGYVQMNFGSTTTAYTGYGNRGGWDDCYMRNTLLGNSGTPDSPASGSLLAALPADLRAMMKPITKYSDNTGGGSTTASNVTASEDFLWLFSEFEVMGTSAYANIAEQNYQEQYAYYAAGNSKVHYKHNATSTTAVAWCRSVAVADAKSFCRLGTDGKMNYLGANRSYGMAPMFAV